MKAVIYNPYLDTLGGGERYTLSFAKVLLLEGYEVDLEWSDKGIIDKLEDRFGIDLKGLNIVPDVKKGDGYDLCFWVSDGSIPLMHARRNILHFQVPFHEINGKSLMNKMKLFRINNIICNSNFTKDVIDREFGVKSIVIYPPVDTKEFKSKRKENTILYVGRFSKILQSKGQEYLVESFKKMFDSGVKDWKLVLAGGNEVGAGDFIEGLKKQSIGYPIEIVESPSFRILTELYGRSKIFWSASGYGKDESKNPELMEHFGMTVVEAMSAGNVPVLYNGGGYKEIVENSVSGYLWNNLDELLEKTMSLIVDPKKLSKLASSAKASAQKYGIKTFEEKVVEIIK